MMLGIHWGLKSYYYSLLNKIGAKERLKEDNVIAFTPPEADEDDSDCLACKL
jgi:hypothetical protein